MSEVNYRRNGRKYTKNLRGHGHSRRGRAASNFWKKHHGEAKRLRREPMARLLEAC